MDKSLEQLLRDHYNKAVAERDMIIARSQSHRDAYEAKRREIERIERDELRPLEKALRESQEGLFEISNEVAAIAQALGGRTGVA